MTGLEIFFDSRNEERNMGRFRVVFGGTTRNERVVRTATDRNEKGKRNRPNPVALCREDFGRAMNLECQAGRPRTEVSREALEGLKRRWVSSGTPKVAVTPACKLLVS